MSHRRGSLGPNLLLLALSLTFAALLAEGGLRLLAHFRHQGLLSIALASPVALPEDGVVKLGHMIRLSPNPHLIYEFKPDLDVNFIGPFMLTAALTPLLRRSGTGRVLNLGTQVGSFGNLTDPDSPLLDDICPSYQASKIALNAATALFAKELRNDGVTVNSACPGWVMTDMGHDDLPDYGDTVAPMSPTEAVQNLMWLLDTDPPPTGGFWSLGEEVAW